MTTINTQVAATWTLAGAGEGAITLSAYNASNSAEFCISADGTPAESIIGHPCPRFKAISMQLGSGESVYLRNPSDQAMIAAISQTATIAS